MLYTFLWLFHAKTTLAGGLNPVENYARQIGSFPPRVKIENVLNQHLENDPPKQRFTWLNGESPFFYRRRIDSFMMVFTASHSLVFTWVPHQKSTRPQKRYYFKRKFHLLTIDFQGIFSVFGGKGMKPLSCDSPRFNETMKPLGSDFSSKQHFKKNWGGPFRWRWNETWKSSGNDLRNEKDLLFSIESWLLRFSWFLW